jgi:hypothetical protein
MQSHEGVQYLVISLLIIFKATSKDDGIAMSVAYALFTHFSAYWQTLIKLVMDVILLYATSFCVCKILLSLQQSL